MCSTKWERPLSAAVSKRAPTLTNSAHTAVWRCGSATVVTARPLSRWVVSTVGSSYIPALSDVVSPGPGRMLLKKIVIAEDDDAIAHMVNMSLGDAGFLCLRARDGDEALKL